MNKTVQPAPWILPVIVFSQFACTSLWFAGNAVTEDLIASFNIPSSALGDLLSAVQFGFITGTLLFALLTIADRFSPSKVFLVCAVLGALFNGAATIGNQGMYSLLLLRFATGFCLAGIYPVGMKIAADYHEKGLGKALGYLVGALVVGTAFPHFLKSFDYALLWQQVLLATSAIAILGGLLMWLLVPDGPFRKPSSKVDFKVFFQVFQSKQFRGAAFGYFGHMWELYAFWAFVPLMLSAYVARHTTVTLNVSLWSFIIIAIGGLSCVVGGYISLKYGSKKVALISLLSSGICCLLSPLAFQFAPVAFIAFLLYWGWMVIADSPQFSTMVAQSAPAENKGTALTIVNSIGFAITIISIQAINILLRYVDYQEYIYLLLALGPIFGLWAILRNK